LIGSGSAIIIEYRKFSNPDLGTDPDPDPDPGSGSFCDWYGEKKTFPDMYLKDMDGLIFKEVFT